MSDNLPGTVPDKLQPHNVNAEEALLGSLLIDPDAIMRVSTFLNPKDFFVERHGWIFSAVRDLHERRDPPDLVTLSDELDRRGQLEELGGPAYLSVLANATPSSIHAEAYGRIVERTAVLRRLIDAASRIAQLAYQNENTVEETIDRAEEIIFSVSARRAERDLRPLESAIEKFYDRLEYLYKHQGRMAGVPTGLNDLDRLLGGLQNSDMVVLAGRPGMGKTSLALSIALQAARRWEKRVAMFSLEMSDEQLVQRLIAAETGIDNQRIRLGTIQEQEWKLLLEAGRNLRQTRFFIDDTPAISPFELRTKARRLHAEHGVDLLIVDYLQLMSGGGRIENRQQEISLISRSIKALARELNIPVLALSQLSRQVESRHDKRPMLSDLRESGCLAGDTLIYQPHTGQAAPIREMLPPSHPRHVTSLNLSAWQLETAPVSHAFCTGVKPVFRLQTESGRAIKATANHKFLTMAGWKRLDQLKRHDRVATPQQTAQATGAIGWDPIIKITPAGTEEVFDLTVPQLHNFVANEIIVHNSIEQDADVVLFIYRDEVYNPEVATPDVAEIIVGKHRSGPTGRVEVFFKKKLARFEDLGVETHILED